MELENLSDMNQISFGGDEYSFLPQNINFTLATTKKVANLRSFTTSAK